MAAIGTPAKNIYSNDTKNDYIDKANKMIEVSQMIVKKELKLSFEGNKKVSPEIMKMNFIQRNLDSKTSDCNKSV